MKAQKTRKVKILAVIFSSAVLAVYGCGGGGGGGGGTGTPPSAPTGITGSPGDRQVVVSWDAVSDAASYNIYWSTASGVTKANGTKIEGVTSPYSHAGLTGDTTYYYVVTAVNSYGESSESSQVSARPAPRLLATLSWDKANDMDLHLNYYTEDPPTSISQLDWYVDYHTGDNSVNGMKSSCTSPLDNNITWHGIDSNGDGTCEIGLDQDVLDGSLPEHITATSLPPGHYVLSINSRTLNSQGDTTVTVTVSIDGNVPPSATHTFNVEDLEGIISGAWYRVCDIHVASDGTVDKMDPDPVLTPWHFDEVNGLPAPKRGAKMMMR